MKKLLFYTSIDLTTFSGERTHIINFIKHLPTSLKIFLICSNINEETKRDLNRKDLKIISPPNFRNSMVKKIITPFLFLKIAKKESPELIYIRSSIYVFFVSYLLDIFLKNNKIIMEINGVLIIELKKRNFPSLLIKLITFFEKGLLKKTDYVICVSEMIKQNLLRNYQLDAKKFFVCPNGIDTKLFKPIKKKVAFLRTKLDPSYKYIGYVGGLTEWQNLEVFIDAFPLLLKENSKFRFLIVGGGRKEKNLEEKLKKIGLGKMVLLTGVIPYKELPYWISILNLGILPDTRIKENQFLSSPLKLWEYLACGIPVIGFRAKEIELLEKEGIGFIVSQDPKVIKKKILQFFEFNIKKEKEIKEKARIIAMGHSWENTVKSTLNLIDFKV